MVKRGYNKSLGTKQKLSLISMELRPWDHKMALTGSTTEAQQSLEQNIQTQMSKMARGRPSRWRKSKTWRSPSSPQIHQKYIYMWKNSYRTPTERWQKTSDLPKGKKLPTYLGRAKEKRKNRDKRRGTGPAPVGGSCEGGKVSTH